MSGDAFITSVIASVYMRVIYREGPTSSFPAGARQSSCMGVFGIATMAVAKQQLPRLAENSGRRNLQPMSNAMRERKPSYGLLIGVF
jgi:hypothetical protein